LKSSQFSDRVRVRACAVIAVNSSLLLIKQTVPTRDSPIWIPPGGGVLVGETLETALTREVLEETGLKVLPEQLLWIHEFLETPYHAIEFYFECSIVGGMLKLGKDPELPKGEQVLHEVRFVSSDEILTLPVFPEFLKKIFDKKDPLSGKIERIISY